MANHFFRFKQFVVNQEHCAMKVGTDGVLLGAWCDVACAGRILDIGTGTGLISLMMAQRNDKARIDALEIDGDACRQAALNFEDSPWKERLQAIEGSFVDFAANHEERYDRIVSNPPYFEASLKAACAKRTVARHTDSLSFESLIGGAASLLTPQGILSLVYPVDADPSIDAIARSYGLRCSRKVWVRGTLEAPRKRVLAEYVFGPSEEIPQECELVVEKERHVYTEEYIELTRDFYLKM